MRKVLRKIFAVMLCLLALASYVPQVSLADGLVTLSLESDVTLAGQGDIVRLDITADNFPGITSFGPITVQFDLDKAEFISLENGDLPGNFVYTTTQTDESVTISAVDSMTSGEVDLDEEDSENIISAYTSEEPLVLYSLYMRIMPNADGVVDFWLENLGSFVDATGTEVESSKGSGVTILVNQSISTDATLAFLDVSGVALVPDFNPNITEYSATVERSVTSVDINATANNLWAAVVIDGNMTLDVGVNTVTIDVTAQDGKTHVEYVINITRKESYVPEDAVLVDGEGTVYNFVDLPTEFTIPDGFTQVTRNINGFSVPAFIREGLSSILVYLYDGQNQPGFYFYNSNLKTVTPYVEGSTVIRSSKVFTNVEVPEGTEIPAGFTPAELELGESVISGYINADGEFVCYLEDESGIGGFYTYRQEDGAWYKFAVPDKTRENVFKYMFLMFFTLSVLEALIIIIIVFLVRKIIVDRNNPRPKRV